MDSVESFEIQVQKMFDNIRQSSHNSDMSEENFHSSFYTPDDISLYWKTFDIAQKYTRKAIEKRLSAEEMQEIADDMQNVFDFHRTARTQSAAHKTRFAFAQHLLNSVDAIMRAMLDNDYVFSSSSR